MFVKKITELQQTAAANTLEKVEGTMIVLVPVLAPSSSDRQLYRLHLRCLVIITFVDVNKAGRYENTIGTRKRPSHENRKNRKRNRIK